MESGTIRMHLACVCPPAPAVNPITVDDDSISSTLLSSVQY